MATNSSPRPLPPGRAVRQVCLLAAVLLCANATAPAADVVDEPGFPRSVYLGPSLFARFPVIRLVVDLEALEAWPTGRLGADFQTRLVQSLPGLAEHGCSYGGPGGFLRRMAEDEGTWLGHVLEHCAIELQNVAGTPVTRPRRKW